MWGMAPRVKICGVTRLEDALLAAELGAWAVGLNFWPGTPRRVDLDAADRDRGGAQAPHTRWSACS